MNRRVGRNPATTGQPRRRAGGPIPATLAATIGNRAMSGLIQRQTGGAGGGGGGRRVVMLDGLVLDQINRGNRDMAKAFNALRASGARIVIGESVAKELGADITDKQMRSVYDTMLRELGIEVNPADLRSTGQAREAFLKQAKVQMSAKDSAVAAEAMAARAELWTTDRAYRKNPTAVKKNMPALQMAPESLTDVVSGHWDYNDGRKAVGLEPITVHKDGSITRSAAQPRGSTHVRGGKELREVASDTRVKGSIEIKDKGGGAVTSGPTVVVDDPALRGQTKQGNTTIHHHTEMSGELGGGRPKGGGGGGGGSGGTRVAVKTEEEVVQAAAKSRGALFKRVAAKIGLELLEGLIPDPLDAIDLMIQFAGSYAEARAAIKQRNLRNGFAVGFAARLLDFSWEWSADRLAHKVASRDVLTQVVGAVGVAENAFNEGLVRGYLYGERHSDSQAYAVRGRIFKAFGDTGRSLGTENGFTDRDVYAVAGLLLSAADKVLQEAERRRKARLDAQRAKERREDWTRPVGNKI